MVVVLLACLKIAIQMFSLPRIFIHELIVIQDARNKVTRQVAKTQFRTETVQKTTVMPTLDKTIIRTLQVKAIGLNRAGVRA